MKNNGKMKETSPHAEMDERIALFLRGGMSETEAEAFRAEMKENPKLRERAVLMARLIKQMRKVGKEREQHLVDALQTVDRKTIEMIAKGKGMETMKERKPLMRRLMPWAAAAATSAPCSASKAARISSARFVTAFGRPASRATWMP